MRDELVILGRLVSGRQLNGGRKTNARWNHQGRELRDGAEHAGWWAHQSLRRRAAIRFYVFAWLVTHAVGLAVDFDRMVWTMRVELLIAVLILGWVVVHKTRKAQHHNGWVVPVGAVVADWLGFSRHGDPRDLVTIPLGHRTNPDKPIRIHLPANYREPDRRQAMLAKTVASRAGIKSHDWEVQLEGACPTMLVRAMLVPPDEVMWADDDELRSLVAGCRDDAVLCLGRGLHGKPVWIDWRSDSPHLALSWGSGAGKSTLIRFLAAQTVYKGGRAVIMDGGKDGESHEDWTRDEGLQLINGVEFYPSIAEEHAALVAWEQERQRRSRAKLARTGEQHQRTLIVLEERNITREKLQSYWASIREKGDEARSPALRAVASLVNAGRSVGINCVASAQRFDAAAIGGGDVRGSFQLRSLSRWDEQARRMLIPDITPKPKSSNHPGRAIVVAAGEVTDFQAPYMTAGEAVEWCYSGVDQTDRRIIAPRPKLPEAAETRPAIEASDLDEQGETGSQLPHDEPLTLAEAADRFGLTLKVLRNGRERDEAFPEPIARGLRGASLYRADDLEEWSIAREERMFTS